MNHFAQPTDVVQYALSCHFRFIDISQMLSLDLFEFVVGGFQHDGMFPESTREKCGTIINNDN